MANRFAEAARIAREATNKELASEIAAVSNGLSRERINELLPAKKDKEAFLELMKQVEAETAMDEKIAYLHENIKSAGVIAMKLLKVLV